MSKKHNILLVEDDEDIHEIMREILENAGFNVTSKRNGQEALDHLSQCKTLPSLIFLDQHMPVKNGIEFRQDQLKNPKWAQIPVVMITADGHIEEKVQLEIPTGIEIMKKPFALEALLAEIDRHLKKRLS